LFETVGRFYKADLSGARTALSAQSNTSENADKAVCAPEPDNLPSIAGLDTKDGLTRVAGNRKLYLKLLRQFAEQQGPAVGQITAALSNGDIALAERLAHTVKGVAGNLGAKPVQQIAAKVEKGIAAKTPVADLAPLLSELNSTLEDFVSRVRAALPTAAATTTATASVASIAPERLKQVTREMAAHLQNFDPAAGDCFEANRDVFQTLLPGDQFASFEQHVSGFAFAEALALLEPIAKEKGLLPA
jgi:HPt (histidine-containing phosphotransfer) domain-containing protein